MVSIISEKAWKIALFLSLQNVAVLHFHCFRLPGAFSQRHHAQGLRVRRVADWIWIQNQENFFMALHSGESSTTSCNKDVSFFHSLEDNKRHQRRKTE